MSGGPSLDLTLVAGRTLFIVTREADGSISVNCPNGATKDEAVAAIAALAGLYATHSGLFPDHQAGAISLLERALAGVRANPVSDLLHGFIRT
jgi:hypothetical protein